MGAWIALLLAADVQVSELAVSRVESFACARYTNGDLWCAGEGTVGQLGFGKDLLDDPTLQPGKYHPPKKVLRVKVPERIVAGLHTACAMMIGTVWCWGLGGNGELGWGECRADPTPQLVKSTGGDAVALAAGDSHACLVTKEGTVQCWGLGRDGQIGDGSNEKQCRPVVVPGVTGAKQVALGSTHSCALDAKGAVWCWGPKAPAVVAGTGKVDAIAAAGLVTCARSGKAVKCWGGTFGEKPVAAKVLTEPGLFSVGGAVCTDQACTSPPSCAIGKDGKVHCVDGSKLKAVAERF